MKRTLTVLAAVVTLASPALAAEGMSSPGASGNTPGHQMQDSRKSTGPGASEYAPGQKMKGDTTGSTGTGDRMGTTSGSTTGTRTGTSGSTSR